MKNQRISREQLMEELVALRQQVAALEASKHKREQTESELQRSNQAVQQLAEDALLLTQIGRIVSSTLEIDQGVRAIYPGSKETRAF
jgi:chaperonin cofactor prefoldin